MCGSIAGLKRGNLFCLIRILYKVYVLLFDGLGTKDVRELLHS